MRGPYAGMFWVRSERIAVASCAFSVPYVVEIDG